MSNFFEDVQAHVKLISISTFTTIAKTIVVFLFTLTLQLIEHSYLKLMTFLTRIFQL